MGKQDIDIKIDSIGRRGDGIGAWQGQPVFVPRALPGERVSVRIGKPRDRGYAAALMDIIDPSPDRAAPPCSYYEACGGCALQHWSESAYRSWKEEYIRGLLQKAHITAGEWKSSVFVPDGTRRRATLAALLKNKRLSLGYHRARSHDIADIPQCLLLTPRLRTLMDAMRPFLADILTDGRPADIFVQDTGSALDVMITGMAGSRREPQLKQREAMAQMAQECGIARLCWRFRERETPEIIVRHGPVIKRGGNLAVELPPGAFLQPSAEGEAALLAAIKAPLGENLKIADLFAGCGTFSGPLLNHGKVHAVEEDTDAATALAAAARHVAGLSVEKRDLFDNPLRPTELKNYNALVFDPPRAGAMAQATQLAQSQVPLVIGVSCHPASFARDARILIDGGYNLSSVQIVDQFTWSSHTELVGVFRKP